MIPAWCTLFKEFERIFIKLYTFLLSLYISEFKFCKNGRAGEYRIIFDAVPQKCTLPQKKNNL